MKSTVIFQIEMGFDSGTGVLQQGGLAWGRQAYVGIAGTNWSVTAGRQLGPNELAMAGSDALTQYYWGSTSGYGIGTLQSPGSAAGSGCHGATLRINNSVQGTYSTSGLTMKLLIGAGDENDRGTGRIVNPAVTLTLGKLTLTGGWARLRECAADISAGASPTWQTELLLGGTYELDHAKLFGGYYDWNPSETNRTVGSSIYVDHKAIWIGTRVGTSPPGTVIAQLARLVDRLQDGSNASAVSYGLAYEHEVSKRTRLYASTGCVRNGIRARFGLNAATAVQAAGGAGADPKVVSFGVTHTF